jgi:CRP/FNR family cyclic AMP-dependent transcriptional regulator
MNLSPENDEACGSCEFNENLNLFREIPFFAGMSLQTHKVLAYLCSRETYDPGERLFQQGDDDGRAFYLLSGSAVMVHRRDQRQIVTRKLSAGDFFGGMALLGSAPRLFSVEALDTVVCLALSRDNFHRLEQQFPDILPRAVKAVVRGVFDWEKRLLRQATNNGLNGLDAIVGVSLL